MVIATNFGFLTGLLFPGYSTLGCVSKGQPFMAAAAVVMIWSMLAVFLYLVYLLIVVE